MRPHLRKSLRRGAKDRGTGSVATSLRCLRKFCGDASRNGDVISLVVEEEQNIVATTKNATTVGLVTGG